MATRKTTPKAPKADLQVETLKHADDTRKNIPTAEFQSVVQREHQQPVQVTYERGAPAGSLQAERNARNRDLDPQLVWRGKDQQDWSDLVVNAPPLYIQEKVHPKVLIDDLKRQTDKAKAATAPEQQGFTADLFADMAKDFNGLPDDDAKTEFYAHDQHWSNRMILGDSLQVMASLAEREGLRGKVQCIYFDPPYGIKFNSNFQWSTTSRDVKDGNARVRGNDKQVSKPLLFAGMTDEQLLAYGVPAEWLADVKQANEDSLLTLAEHLPAEAAEALLELATGGKPQPASMGKVTDPFSHPDAQRRFRVMHGVAELEQALNYPWEKWTIFLHPSQQQWVMRDYAGPARVSGSAGTGKTIVALHRAVVLAREHPDARVWLTTFSETLAHALQNKINCLISHQPRLAERLEVADMNAMGQRLMDRLTPKGQAKPRLATPAQVREAAAASLAEVKAASDGALLTRFNLNFVLGEWTDVVDAWQLQNWDDYRDVKRLGRKTRLNEAQRQALWHVFTGIQSRLAAAGVVTDAAMFTQLAHQLASLKHPPFDYVVVDEAQDVSISQLRMLAAMAGVAPDGSGSVRRNSLFFAGDLGQRIFQQPFSWKSLGVDVRGRSRTLHINYRTSHQIRQQADRLLGPEVSDSDGNTESRKGTVSVFNGPAPLICSYKDQATEIAAVADWLKGLTEAGYAPHEVGVFVRSEAQLDRAIAALQGANMPLRVLDEHVETSNGQASVCTMHLAKGLEFRAVVVMACDDEVIPLQSRIESVMDESDLLDVYDTERHLLYVACTRARDRLLVSSVSPASEFVDDLSSN